MRLPLSIPLVVRNVRVEGPKGSVNLDMILDTGAALTALSWADLKVIGYDPAIVPDRQEIITANGVIEVPKLRINRKQFPEFQYCKPDPTVKRFHCVLVDHLNRNAPSGIDRVNYVSYYGK